MARPLRVEFGGAVYHVLNRGDRGEDIFRDNIDRYRFIEALSEACEKTGWRAHAYCLMRNHFHLVIETPMPNLVAGMKWLLGAYSNRFNRRHKLIGHLFAGRYKAILVDVESRGYLKTVCDYVHLNPVRAGLVKSNQALSRYVWSSYPEYLKSPQQRWKHLDVERLFGEHGIRKDSIGGRNEFRRRMEARQVEDNSQEWEIARRGWALGSEEFRREILERISAQGEGRAHAGREIRASAEEKARRLIREELVARRLTAAQLAKLPKGAAEKVAIARRVRAETTAPLRWIAAELCAGTAGYLWNRLGERAPGNYLSDERKRRLR